MNYTIKKNKRGKSSIIVKCPRCGKEGSLIKKSDKKINITHGNYLHYFGIEDKDFDTLMNIIIEARGKI